MNKIKSIFLYIKNKFFGSNGTENFDGNAFFDHLIDEIKEGKTKERMDPIVDELDDI